MKILQEIIPVRLPVGTSSQVHSKMRIEDVQLSSIS